MTIRILSIDGGGTRGLFPATILRQLENDLGKKVTEVFDVIIGSATGGIIATLARYIISLVMYTKMATNQYLSRQILPEQNYMRVNAYYNDESASNVLRNRKLKIDVTDR